MLDYMLLNYIVITSNDLQLSQKNIILYIKNANPSASTYI